MSNDNDPPSVRMAKTLIAAPAHPQRKEVDMTDGPGIGSNVVDKTTGFVGVITAITYYISGASPRAYVESRDLSDGKTHGEWFDLCRLEESL